MSELLTDEELTEALAEIDIPDHNRLAGTRDKLAGHIDALTEQRDYARSNVSFALETARIQAKTIETLTGQRDRARLWAVQLEQELNAAGGHAHANQQAIEGEA